MRLGNVRQVFGGLVVLCANIICGCIVKATMDVKLSIIIDTNINVVQYTFLLMRFGKYATPVTSVFTLSTDRQS